MTDLYPEGARALQDRFGTRPLADRLETVKVHAALTPGDRALIERMDMVFLATADAAGRPQCSYKGGDPGFVRVLDDRTLVLPSYDGNGMFLSAGNLAANPHVALLFVDFAGRPPRRLRVNGDASVEPADAHGAQFSIRIHVTHVFPNCPRYVHRLARVERSPYVPRAGFTPPVPEWKRADWARDVLPR